MCEQPFINEAITQLYTRRWQKKAYVQRAATCGVKLEEMFFVQAGAFGLWAGQSRRNPKAPLPPFLLLQ